MRRVKHIVPHSTKSSRRAGRPREFDEAEALAAARDVFLEKGLAAATLDDLTGAMNINRPSLYAAFTGKEALYLKALDAYAAAMAGHMVAALEGSSRIEDALRRFYGGALDVYYAEGKKAVGCFIVCSAVPESTTNEAVRERAVAVLQGIDAALERRLRRAVEYRELPRQTDAAALARLAAAVLHSLAVRVRSGAKRKTLDAFVEDAIRLLLPGR
jgi:AcrR family transcriptional regulator